MRLTYAEYVAKWSAPLLSRFKDNDYFEIDEADFRDFAQDTLDTCQPLPTNLQFGGPFFVKFVHDEEGAGGSLLGLDQRLLCIGAVATVEYAWQDGKLYRNQRYYVAFDSSDTPQLLVYLNGYGTGPRTVGAKWVREGSEEAAQDLTANVPLLDPTKTDYPADYLVRQPYGGKDYLFRTEAAGGPFPAPFDYHGDANWQAVALPTPPTTLATAVALDYMRNVVLPQGGPTPGVLHALYGNWNNAGTTVTVEVQAGLQGFAATGTLVVGSTRTAVQVDVVAGTYGPLASPAAPQWVAGKQQAGQLVYNDSTTWRVKQNIANSQAGPTVAAPNAQYYEFVGSAAQQATVQQHTQQLAALIAGKQPILSGDYGYTTNRDSSTLPQAARNKYTSIYVTTTSSVNQIALPDLTEDEGVVGLSLTFTGGSNNLPVVAINQPASVVALGRTADFFQLGVRDSAFLLGQAAMYYGPGSTGGNGNLVTTWHLTSLARNTQPFTPYDIQQRVVGGSWNGSNELPINPAGVLKSSRLGMTFTDASYVYVCGYPSQSIAAPNVPLLSWLRISLTATPAGPGGATYTAGPGIAISSQNVLSTVVAPGSGTTLVFTQDAEYAPILNGTFAVDATGAQVGRVVFAYLGPGASAPTLPSGFQLLNGSYQAGANLMYAFKVGANGQIQYTISQLP